MGAVDQHPPKPQLAHDLIQRALRDQVFLGDIAHTVERRPQQRKQVSLELVPTAYAPAIGAGDVIGGEQDAHAADADEYAEDLGWVVADVEEEEGDCDDEDDGPEVDELGGEDGGVAVGEDGEVIAFNVEEGEDDVWMRVIIGWLRGRGKVVSRGMRGLTFPPVFEEEAGVAFEAVTVDGVGGVDNVEEDIVEEGLEGGDGGAASGEEGREGIGGGNT